MAETVEAIVAEAAAVLARAGSTEPRRYARRLVAASLALSPTELLMWSDQAVDGEAIVRLRRLVDRVARGEPISRVIGRREFWGLDFSLSADTLDPRPDSETIVEAVLARLCDRAIPLRVLDLGTGTGCMLLALLSELPAAFGVGIDISEGAVATARRNAQALGLAGRACFFVGDWGRAVGAEFDVVVANPPYIRTAALADLPAEVRKYDPLRALDGGEDGLGSYRPIAEQLSALIAPGGIFAGEVGAGQAAAAAAVLEAAGIYLEAFERDLAGIERCVIARKIAGTVAEVSGTGQKTLGMCLCPD